MPRMPLHTRALIDSARALGPDLVAAWCEAMRPCDEPLSSLLDQLAEEIGFRPSLSRLGEWRNGRRPVPAEVQSIMRRDLCRYLCGDDGLGDALAARMEPPTVSQAPARDSAGR